MGKEKLTQQEVVPKKKKSNVTDVRTLIQKIGLHNLIILLMVGVLLFLFTFPNSSRTKEKKIPSVATSDTPLKANPMYSEADSESEEYVKQIEERLQKILEKVEGIGKVEVMITLSSSKELVTLKDAPYTQETVNENDGEGGSRVTSKSSKEDTSVMSSTQEGGTSPYIVKELEPIVEGVVVSAQGGADAMVQKDIIEAAEVLFNIPIHKVKVLRMHS